jgi:hypothetical protein
MNTKISQTRIARGTTLSSKIKARPLGSNHNESTLKAKVKVRPLGSNHNETLFRTR